MCGVLRAARAASRAGRPTPIRVAEAAPGPAAVDEQVQVQTQAQPQPRLAEGACAVVGSGFVRASGTALGIRHHPLGNRSSEGRHGPLAAPWRPSQMRWIGQWLPASSPLSFSWIWALGLFRPMISTVLPRWAYLVSIASRAATEEASQMCAAVRSMTTLSGSVA